MVFRVEGRGVVTPMAITINSKTKGLIFDLDGTLSNSLPALLEMTGRPTIKFAKRIVEENDIDVTPEVLVELKQELFWKSAHLLQPINEVVEIVKNYYRKLPMAVGTGAGRKSTTIQLKELNLTNYFDAIVCADDVTKHKPEPETFLECARLIGVEPQFCQVFEDGELGIAAAKKAGMIVTDIRDYINYGDWAQ